DGEVLDRRLLRRDHRAVGLDDADVNHFELVAERTVADFQLTQRLHAAVTVYLDARIDLLAAGAVVFETKGLDVVLGNEGFLGIVGRRLGRRGGGLSRNKSNQKK